MSLSCDTGKRKKKYSRRNELVRKRRDELIIRAGGHCADCKWGFGFHMYDFHHVDPETKKFTLTGKNLTRRWEDVLEEFKKCVLLCPNCHRERHFKLDRATVCRGKKE